MKKIILFVFVTSLFFGITDYTLAADVEACKIDGKCYKYGETADIGYGAMPVDDALCKGSALRVKYSTFEECEGKAAPASDSVCKCESRCVKTGEKLTSGSTASPIVDANNCSVTGCEKMENYATCLESLKEKPSETVEGVTSMVLPDASSLNQTSYTSIQTAIGGMIQKGMGIIGSIFLLMFVYGGVLFMISMGNAEKNKQGKDILVWSSLGILIILSSYALVNFLFNVF